MPTRLKKTRRLRGSRCHGWGRSGQHRAGGMQGGHGKAGWKRHKWSAVIRYGLTIGEKGFTPPGRRVDRTINVGEVALLVDRFVEEGYAQENNGAIEIDLRRAGYDKLLGSGPLGPAKKPLRITVEKSSERAIEKIGEAGGQVVLPEKASSAEEEDKEETGKGKEPARPAATTTRKTKDKSTTTG